MATKVEALRIGPYAVRVRRGFVKAIAQALKVWGQRGQLGSNDLAMRI